MSELSERTNIMSIDEVTPVGEGFGSMATLNDISSYQSLDLVLSGIQTFIPGDVLSALNATSSTLKFTTSKATICSPNTLRASFQTSFSPTLKKLESLGINPLTAKKASLISSLRKMDFKLSQSASIRSSIQTVFKSSEIKSLNNEIKIVMQKLEVAHTEVFVNKLAKVCAIASFNVGFKEVEIKSVQGKLEVIATNKTGQRIISEINVDAKTNHVNANTETIGITDGSCITIVNKFNEQLKKMNIKIGHEKNSFTGGVCKMTYAKILDKQDKESLRSKREQERTKKLNNNQKQKN